MIDLLCKACGETKPASSFARTIKYKLMLARKKSGTVQRNRQAPRDYRVSECNSCRYQKRKAADPSGLAAYQAQKFQKNKEKYKPARQRWYKDNPLTVDFVRARTRARRAGATEFMSLEEWTELRTQELCHWCYCVLKRSFTNIDHVLPLAEGGQHTRKNVVLACANCNMEREWQRKTTQERA